MLKKKNLKAHVFFPAALLVFAIIFLTVFYAACRLPGSAAVRAAGLRGFFSGEKPDHLAGSYTTIVDEEGSVLSMMARTVFAGDELYTAEGRTYRIESVRGSNAKARFLGMDPQIVAYNEYFAGLGVPVMKMMAEQKPASVAVYHTHSDESYVPTDGAESIPFKGGIYQVGRSLAEKLQRRGSQVHYDQTPHDPHDNNAYVRSRRTAANLLKANPSAILDVHRDGVPDPSYYRTTIDGKSVAKLRLVVGRENPRMDANMDFAKKTMAAANNMHPNVVKEIFVGKGDYNQDLSPTALLIEAGTHTNTREEAAEGVAMFAEALPAVLGAALPGTAAAPGAGRTAGTAGGALKALGWIVGLTVAGGLIFLLVSSGSWENAKKRLAGFSKEFTSAFGPRRVRKKRAARKNGPGGGDAGAPLSDSDAAGDRVLAEAKDDVTND